MNRVRVNVLGFLGFERLFFEVFMCGGGDADSRHCCCFQKAARGADCVWKQQAFAEGGEECVG